MRQKFLQGTATLTAAITGGGAKPMQASTNTPGSGGSQPSPAEAKSENLSAENQGITDASQSEPTIYVAKKIITMENSQPTAEAVAVAGDTILAVGSLDQVKKELHQLGYQDFDQTWINDTFQKKFILPGFIEHHVHPLLGAMTMAVEVIAIEDWTVPGKESKAAKNESDYKQSLKEAINKMPLSDAPPEEQETLFTWGYHHYFHGDCYLPTLDDICINDLEVNQPNRPVVIWHRSCHEFIFNSAALRKYGIDQDLIDGSGDELAKSQADLANGHFWEKGMELILGKIAADLLSDQRVQLGINIFRKYLLSKGVTTICEPGTQMNDSIQTLWHEKLSTEDTAFRTYFVPDGRALYDQHKKDGKLDELINDTKKWITDCPTKKPDPDQVEWLDNQVKLFADGAIFSQLMQLQDPYLDDTEAAPHQGQWIAEPEDYKAAFELYWKAGYQIHGEETGAWKPREFHSGEERRPVRF